MCALGEVLIAEVISWAIGQKYVVGDHKPLKYDNDNDEIDYKKPIN